MKICLLTSSYPTWKEGPDQIIKGKFVHDMAKHLVRAGIEVHVVTQHDRDTPAREVKDGVAIHRFRYFFGRETLTGGAGIPENIKKLGNKLQVPFYVGALMVAAYRLIRRHGIDVINAHWGFPTGYLGVLLKKVTGARLVTTLYGAELFPVLAGRHGSIRGLLTKALLGADALAGISAETVQAARAISGRGDIRVIPDGIDMEYYRPGERNEALLARYGLAGKRVVFFTGRMVERKGHRFLIEAMAEVAKAVPDVKCLLGGDGPLFAQLAQLRSRLGLKEVVEMPGFLPEEELVSVLQSVDLHVLPSCVDANGDTEGSATAAFEAMACGTPSIVSRVGGNIGAIEEGRGARYFEAGNPADLARTMIELLGDPDLMRRTAGLGRSFVMERYSWEQSIAKYLGLLEGANLR